MCLSQGITSNLIDRLTDRKSSDQQVDKILSSTVIVPPRREIGTNSYPV
jgi:hypothetical protein